MKSKRNRLRKYQVSFKLKDTHEVFDNIIVNAFNKYHAFNIAFRKCYIENNRMCYISCVVIKWRKDLEK